MLAYAVEPYPTLVAAQVLQEGDLVCEGRVSELPSSAPTAQAAADANSQRSSALDGLKAGTLPDEPLNDDCTLLENMSVSDATRISHPTVSSSSHTPTGLLYHCYPRAAHLAPYRLLAPVLGQIGVYTAHSFSLVPGSSRSEACGRAGAGRVYQIAATAAAPGWVPAEAAAALPQPPGVGAEPAPWDVHPSARAARDPSPVSPDPTCSSSHAGGPDVVDAGAFYRGVRRAGMHYGAAFRVVLHTSADSSAVALRCASPP